MDAFQVTEIKDVPQLVDLIRTNGLEEQLAAHPRHIGATAGNHCQASPGKGELGCRAEQEGAIRITGRFAGVQNVAHAVRMLAKIMDRIGVVPENSEVGSPGGHPCQSVDSAVRIDRTGRVTIQGHAPDTFYRGVFCHQGFHGVHVGAVIRHGDRYHFNAQMLANGKMPIISGAGTDKFQRGLPAPGDGIVAHPMQHGAQKGVVHQIEAAVAANDDFFRCHAHVIGKQFFGFRQPIQAAVISAIGALRRTKIIGGNVLQQSV